MYIYLDKCMRINSLINLVFLIKVGSLHSLHIQLERTGNMIHHALCDESGGQSAGRSTGAAGRGVGIHHFDNKVPVGNMVGWR